MRKKYHFRPFLRFVTDGEEGGDPKPEVSEGGDFGFPANTPVRDMTAEQQAAYWKDKSRKHEKNRKPDDYDDKLARLAELEAQVQAAEDAKKSPDEKELEQKLAAAKAAAKEEALGSILPRLVRAEFARKLPDLDDAALDELLEDISPSAYVKDGDVDVERVERMAKRLAPAKAEDDKSGEPTFTLGHILRNTTPPKPNKSESIQEARERARAPFTKQDK